LVRARVRVRARFRVRVRLAQHEAGLHVAVDATRLEGPRLLLRGRVRVRPTPPA